MQSATSRPPILHVSQDIGERDSCTDHVLASGYFRHRTGSEKQVERGKEQQVTDESHRLERLSSGIDGLDTILRGGLLCGAAYIVNGPPGAGKTILANQFCFHHAAHGRKALYISLLSEAHDRMLAFMRSMQFYNPDQVPDRLYYISVYRTLQEEGLKGILRLVSEEIRHHKAAAVVLDGLFVIHDSASGEHEFRQFVHELQGQATISGATILMLTNQSRQPSAPEHTMVDGWIELLDEMHDARSVRSLIVRKQRGDSYHRGRHLFRITEQGIELFPRIESVLKPAPLMSEATERFSTGISPLDTMLGGGYPAASTSIVLGPSGSGKTIFGLHYLSCCTPEAPGILFGFYEPPGRLCIKARRIGIDLEGLVERGAVEIVWQSPAENLADELGHRLLTVAKRRGAKRVFVDGMRGFEQALLFKNRLPALLNALNHALKADGATVFYSMETHRLVLPEELQFDEISAMVDNVVLLHYAMREGAFRRNVSILKVRDSDFDPFTHEFHISSGGVRFGDRLGQLTDQSGTLAGVAHEGGQPRSPKSRR
jgi:circadian clock protein KaiC